jgi:hypothetical protein
MANIYEEHAAATSRLARIKAESQDMAHKATFLVAAFAAPAALGFVNAKEGGSAAAPYQVAGKVNLDTLGAAAGIAGAFLLRKSKHRVPVLGASAGLVGVLGYRYGAQWQAQSPFAGLMSGGSSSASGGSTPAGAGASTASTGWGGHQAPRMMNPGGYGSRQNPYAQHFAARKR